MGFHSYRPDLSLIRQEMMYFKQNIDVTLLFSKLTPSSENEIFRLKQTYITLYLLLKVKHISLKNMFTSHSWKRSVT